MRLRRLKMTDSQRMLEWMQDEEATRYLTIESELITKEKTDEFISESWNESENLHRAIVDETDMYMGTVSLKHINRISGNAEYAISLHRDAIGKGMAYFATENILEIAFKEIGLSKVYLNVIADNKRAIRFYEKYGFLLEGEFKRHIFIKDKLHDLRWYAIFSSYSPKYCRIRTHEKI